MNVDDNRILSSASTVRETKSPRWIMAYALNNCDVGPHGTIAVGDRSAASVQPFPRLKQPCVRPRCITGQTAAGSCRLSRSQSIGAGPQHGLAGLLGWQAVKRGSITPWRRVQVIATTAAGRVLLADYHHIATVFAGNAWPHGCHEVSDAWSGIPARLGGESAGSRCRSTIPSRLVARPGPVAYATQASLPLVVGANC